MSLRLEALSNGSTRVYKQNIYVNTFFLVVCLRPETGLLSLCLNVKRVYCLDLLSVRKDLDLTVRPTPFFFFFF